MSFENANRALRVRPTERFSTRIKWPGKVFIVGDTNMSEQTLTFMTSDLVEVLKKNRTKHVQDFEKAVEKYSQELKAVCLRKLAALKANKKVSPHVQLVFPVSYVNVYDQHIGFFEHTTDKTVRLTVEQYKHFFEDQWFWTQSSDALSYPYHYSSLERASNTAAGPLVVGADVPDFVDETKITEETA